MGSYDTETVFFQFFVILQQTFHREENKHEKPYATKLS